MCIIIIIISERKRGRTYQECMLFCVVSLSDVYLSIAYAHFISNCRRARQDRVPEVGGLAEQTVVIMGVVRQEELVTSRADHQLGDGQTGTVGCSKTRATEYDSNVSRFGLAVRR